MILLTQDDLPSLGEHLKRKCFERGAEDNLTALLVALAEPSEAARELSMGERTLQMDAPTTETASSPELAFPGSLDKTEDALVPASRIAFPAASSQPGTVLVGTEQGPMNIPATQSAAGRSGGSLGRFLLWLLIVGGVAGAFYYGTRYRGPLPFGLKGTTETAAIAPAPTPPDPVMTFEKARREVDLAPADWLNSTLQKETTRQNLINPLDSVEPGFLYLYGRALLLNGNYEVGAKAFEQAIARADQAQTPENSTIRKEAVLGLAAASLKLNKDTERAVSHLDALAPKPAGSASPQ